MDFLISWINNIKREFSVRVPPLNSWRIIFSKEYLIRFINESLTSAGSWIGRSREKETVGRSDEMFSRTHGEKEGARICEEEPARRKDDNSILQPR